MVIPKPPHSWTNLGAFPPGCLAMLLSWALSARAAEPQVDYRRDIQPILANRCYACHGPDGAKRQADLRLDVRKVAVRDAIVPGKASESPLVERISSRDPGERMPPPNSKLPPLSAHEVDLIRRWIDQGAKFEAHWAYVKPVRPPVPDVKDTAWPLGPIDRFILRTLEQQGLAPSREADRRTLIRRLSFDLVGLPPKPEEVEAFAADQSPGAYEKLVDRLLASPHYGERMAVYWLDVVRCADTGGYHSDNHRDVWMFRDYVIQAFNANKPFDRFTLEQLAGDLLPQATQERKVASGYNRLLMTTEEGGAQPKEYTAKYAADRARNTASAWLGATMGCAECHDHKYDPYKTRDFYSFEAFFADVKESAVARQPQTLLPTPEQAGKLAALERELAPLRKTVETQTPELDAAQAEWEKVLKPEEKGKLPKEVAAVLDVKLNQRNDEQKRTLSSHFRGLAPQLKPSRERLAELQRKKEEFEKAVPSTLITETVPPRVVRLLPRGNWMDDSRAIVEPAIPAFLGKLETGARRATRADLAQWLVSRDNPMVARVFVNRLWKLVFGQGIVKTLDDCGTQGALPTHPELLDWLAIEFMDSGWNVKHLLKLMVMSRTYRQVSEAASELHERDPGNQWLARQGVFRLDAEFIRDNALAISGLLSPKIGGPSVKPYQPAGYWDYLNFPKRDYVEDRGEDQYRRGLYTYWQRTFLHPSLLAFDAPTREECTAERARSNTPLQALVLLNDPTYVEAARVFAQRVACDGGSTLEDRLRFAFRQALNRAPRPDEVRVLNGLYEEHFCQYTADEKAAWEVIQVGQSKAPSEISPAELAAWTSITRVLLNLHETITRR